MPTQEYLFQRYIVDELSVNQIVQETQLTRNQIRGRLRRMTKCTYCLKEIELVLSAYERLRVNFVIKYALETTLL